MVEANEDLPVGGSSFTMSQFQPSPFEPIRVYDAPWTFLTQILDGEETEFLDTFVSGGYKLSPDQRDSVITRFKKSMNGGPVADTLIDIATNPFVWAGFLFTPAGATFAKKATGRLFVDHVRNSPFTILQTGNHMTSGTTGNIAAREFNRQVQKLNLEWQMTVGAAEAKMLELNGMKTIDARRIRDPEKREAYEKAMAAIHVKLAGLDKDVRRGKSIYAPKFYRQYRDPRGNVYREEEIEDVNQIEKLWRTYQDAIKNKQAPTLVEDVRAGTFGTADLSTLDKRGPRYGEYTIRAGDQRKGDWKTYELGLSTDLALIRSTPMAKAALEDAIDAVPGARDFMEEVRAQMKVRLLRMVGTPKAIDEYEMTGRLPEDLAEFVDPRKVKALWVGLKSSHLENVHLDAWGLPELLLSRQNREAIRAGELSWEDFQQQLVDGFKSTVNLDAYMPRNVTTWYSTQRGGKPVEVPDSKLIAFDDQHSLATSGRAYPRGRAPVWAIEDLEKLDKWFGGSGYLREQMASNAELVRRAAGVEGRATPMLRIDPLKAISRYATQTQRDIPLFSNELTKEFIEAQQEIIRKINPDEVFDHTLAPDAFLPGALKANLHTADMGNTLLAPEGGWNLSWALEQGYVQLGTKRAQDLMRNTVVPAMMGTLHHDFAFTQGVVKFGQYMAEKFLASPLAKVLGGSKLGDDILFNLKFLVEEDSYALAKRGLGNLASYLYGTHLGVNLSSVLLNLQQPFLHASIYLGADNVLEAYPRALTEMSNYMQARAKYGAFIDPAVRDRLIRDNFEFADQLGLTGHLVEELDRVALQQGVGRSAGPISKATDIVMKPFEKGEWLNRLVTAHAVKNMYKKANRISIGSDGRVSSRGLDYTDMMSDMELMVQETQFGSGVMNTPLIFMASGGDMGNPFANPLIRQFQSFSLRAPLAFLNVGPQLGKTRTMRLGGYEVPWYIGDGFRGLGISAVLYEIGKNMLGADVSSGGFASAVTDITGGGRFLENDSPLSQFTPPVASIPFNFLQGIMTGDTAVLGDSISRSIPGGVALRRVLNVAPQTQGSVLNRYLGRLPQTLQRTYADYASPLEDGSVPLYKGDGTLIEYRDPVSFIYQGLGVDLGKHRHAGNFAHYMTQQRDKMIGMKNNALNALMANDHPGFDSIRSNYERTFGVPLTFTKAQLASRARSRSIPRAERILDRLPREIRDQFALMLQQEAGSSLGIDPSLLGGGTAGTRVDQRPNAVSAESLADLLGQQGVPLDGF